ncbi:MAG: LytTR family transcriptional regulator DNA-binding domain-containing protein [Calditrichaeota bacterium]|nr:LytTR family transcriptional regulator DNA-binding domain-containing protein [Calditrichota bacterium]
MKKTSIVIIDDEKLARDLVKTYLADYSEITIVGEAENAFEGLELVQKQQPDLILLDIQMPKLSGFEMLELLEKYPEIIFTTAFEEYAIKAFEVNAIDYLLKPFSKERFDLAMKKVLPLKVASSDRIEKIDQLMQDYNQSTPDLNRLVFKEGNQIHVISVNDLLYLEAQDDYVNCVTRNQYFLKNKTMKYFETHLDPKKFVRIHRSYIVNLDEMKSLDKTENDSYVLQTHTGKQLPVSRSGYSRLKEVINN